MGKQYILTITETYGFQIPPNGQNRERLHCSDDDDDDDDDDYDDDDDDVGECWLGMRRLVQAAHSEAGRV